MARVFGRVQQKSSPVDEGLLADIVEKQSGLDDKKASSGLEQIVRVIGARDRKSFAVTATRLRSMKFRTLKAKKEFDLPKGAAASVLRKRVVG
jgi:hypothetical protein